MNNFITIPKFLRKSSPVFKHFLDIEDVSYDGMINEKIISLSIKEKDRKGRILMISMIHQDEAESWEAFRELISGLLTDVEAKLHGIFRFELLSIHMTENLEKFQRVEFLQGMTQLAHNMSVGKPQFVQYCSILGVLTKHAMEDFGKINFKPQVQVLDYKPEELDIPLERLMKAGQMEKTFTGMNRLIYYDLSRRPLYDPQNKQQAEAIIRMGRKFDRDLSTALTEVAVIDQNGLHPLFQKSQFEMELF
jgi:hypothetical protein